MDLQSFTKSVRSVIRQRRYLIMNGKSPQDPAVMRKRCNEIEKYLNHWRDKPTAFLKYLKRNKDQFLELIPANQTKRIQEFNQILES